MSLSKSHKWTGYVAGAAFALCASAGAAAYAQTADRAQNEAQADAAKPGVETRIERHMDGGPHMERREERRIVIHDGEGHHHMDQAEHLRTMLQLKPSQEAALTAYLAAVKPEHMHEHIVEMSSHDGNVTWREHDGGPDGAHEAPKTTPERLADMEKRMADSQAEARKRIDATRRFYSQLEPSQKKVFDEMPMLMIGPIGPIGPMMMPGAMKIRFERGDMPPMPPMPPRAPMAPPPPAPPHG